MRRLLVSFAAAGLVLGVSGTAHAGEVNGNGEVIPAPTHASSEGFDDDALAVRGNQSPGGKDRYHGVQNYGMFARLHLKAVVPSPGQTCNPD